MPRDWNALAANSNNLYEANDFKHALYQLVVQQCLYLRQRDQANAYRLISRYRDAFGEAAALMGLRLGFVEQYEFCYVAQDGGIQSQLDLQETLFLLTLRHVYHTHASAGNLSTEGEVSIGIAEFEESYKSLCQRDFDGRSDTLRSLLKMSARHGLARTADAPDGDPQPFVILIFPGIAEALSEYALNRFGADLKARAIAVEALNSKQEISQ